VAKKIGRLTFGTWKAWWLVVCVLWATGCVSTGVDWAGEGKHRLLIRVEPVPIEPRGSDEMPAEAEIDLRELCRQAGVQETVNVASIQVVRYDPDTGQPLPYAKHAYARGAHDRPFRWYDEAVPYEFPEFDQAIDRTDGKIERSIIARAGYYYNILGDWNRGRLAWTHTQEGDQPSFYAVYFDVLPPGQRPAQIPPRGWLGDGMNRCEPVGTTTTGAGHTRIAVTDWDNDGSLDIVYGEDYGHLFWMPNTGSRSSPDFSYSRMIFGTDGLPIDAGVGLAPLVVDWDQDGLKDVLAGTHWDRIAFFKNRGTPERPSLLYQGLIESDGGILQLPFRPIIGRSAAPFKRDYYAVLEAVDWDADGELDLLAGGYVTGRIFFYRNTGRDTNGLPVLKFQGPLEADGEPLNVGDWCAAPTVADFDGDGDLDLITGSYPMVSGKDLQERRSRSFLRYYENAGDRRRPMLRQKDFPREGEFPSGGLATPRAADWNNDGLLDLVVSSRSNIYLFENVGTATRPRFAVHDRPLPSNWGRADLPGTGAETPTQFIDWNEDGVLDVVSGYKAWINQGKGMPGVYSEPISLLPPAERIDHPSRTGDGWFWPRLYDLDQDGRQDVLFGDFTGRIWFHRNLGTAGENLFDQKGYPLRTTDGREIQVGPVGQDPSASFQALQGARTVFVMADFEPDGLSDLVVGDTFGIVRYYRNVGSKGEPHFDQPVAVGDLKSRLLVEAADWDADGRMDIIAGSSGGLVQVFRNIGKEGEARFAEGFSPALPKIIQPRVMMVDLNGDGDQDLFFPGTQGSCLVERSFVEHGYAEGRVLGGVQSRQAR
jgi:hypothetical protein